MTITTPHHDVSEDVFLCALRKRWPRLLAKTATLDELEEWKQFAREYRSRGQQRFPWIPRVLAQAEQLAEQGVEPKQALRSAMETIGVSFPTNSNSDHSTLLRRLEQSYRDRPKHRHALLDPDCAYGVNHAVNALLCRLPEVVAAIFITSDTEMRKRVIRAVF